MRMRRVRAAACGLVITALAATAAQAAPVTAYGAAQKMDDVGISPDGTKVAFATTRNDRRFVVVETLADHKIIKAIGVTGRKLRDVRWAGNDDVLITWSTTGNVQFVIGPTQEWFQTEAYDIPTDKQVGLLDNAGLDTGNAMNVVLGIPDVRIIGGEPIAFMTGIYFNPNGKGGPALFAVNLRSNHTTLRVVSQTAQGWLVDDAGNVVAEADYDEASKRWSLSLAKGGGSLQEVWGTDAAIDVPSLVGFTEDGSAVLVRVPGDGGDTLEAFSLGDGKPAPVPDTLAHAGPLIVDDETQRVIGAYAQGAEPHPVFFEPRTAAIWKSVVTAFGGARVDLEAWSDDKKLVVVGVFGPDDGYNYVLVNLGAGSADLISTAYDGIGPDDVSKVSAISYKAADGMEIPAYLTLPKGRDPHGLALIVMPHGGPEARDDGGFDWWAQALASLGYAVLQPEFRGSEGFGHEFLAAGFGEWGRKMETDLSDGVRTLASQGTIDPKRVCIVGGSYGGYAALAGPTLDPGVYRCAVSVAGISDLRAFLQWERDRQDRSDSIVTRYWLRFMGANSPDDPVLAQISPITFAGKVTVPILLIHGQDDTVVPIAQSQAMNDALKAAGKDVSFAILPSEDHWLSRPETRTEMLTATAAFLEKNNPP